MLIWIGLPFKEIQMKERKAVDQLVLSIALALSEGRELADEPALLQFLKITLAIAAGRPPPAPQGVPSASFRSCTRQVCGQESDAPRHTIVKTALVLEHLLDDPTRRRSADDEDHLLPSGAPAVPKHLERTKKTGLRRVHPRHFVNEAASSS